MRTGFSPVLLVLLDGLAQISMLDYYNCIDNHADGNGRYITQSCVVNHENNHLCQNFGSILMSVG
jgi:hypothetical protein